VQYAVLVDLSKQIVPLAQLHRTVVNIPFVLFSVLKTIFLRVFPGNFFEQDMQPKPRYKREREKEKDNFKKNVRE
jgi:hypothetical protein